MCLALRWPPFCFPSKETRDPSRGVRSSERQTAAMASALTTAGAPQLTEAVMLDLHARQSALRGSKQRVYFWTLAGHQCGPAGTGSIDPISGEDLRLTVSASLHIDTLLGMQDWIRFATRAEQTDECDPRWYRFLEFKVNALAIDRTVLSNTGLQIGIYTSRDDVHAHVTALHVPQTDCELYATPPDIIEVHTPVTPNSSDIDGEKRYSGCPWT